MKTKNYSVYLILIYLWILLVAPHNRFPFLETIRYERISMFLCWFTLLFSGKMKLRMSTLSVMIIIFYIWLLIAYAASPYQGYFIAQHWFEEYWKYIILYFLILFAVNDLNDIHVLLVGSIVIMFLFQAHSWFDFIRGGSYVYQQGIKRIIGIWTTGVGAANYFGMITLFSLPFAIYWYRESKQNKTKMFLVGYIIMTFLSIGFSGTRGALIGVVFLIFINMRSIRQVTVSLMILVLVLSISYFTLPDYLRHRYFSMIIEKEYEFKIDETADEIQKESAQSRLDGLIDGWKMAMVRPIAGFGPGTSPVARNHIQSSINFATEGDLQLHNLYGQLLAETGLVGTILFIVMITIFFMQMRIPQEYYHTYSQLYNLKTALQNYVLIMLFYGFASHTLYRYYWFIAFALQSALLKIIPTLNLNENESTS
jgi:hypothetical protein